MQNVTNWNVLGRHQVSNGQAAYGLKQNIFQPFGTQIPLKKEKLNVHVDIKREGADDDF